jgi:hypothetical protein
VADIGRRLPWFTARNYSVGIDQSECVDDNFSLYGLNRVNDYRNGS